MSVPILLLEMCNALFTRPAPAVGGASFSIVSNPNAAEAAKHICIVAAIIIVFGLLSRGGSTASPWRYDEADYMYAAARGWQANYTDTPTQSVTVIPISGDRREVGLIC